MNLTVTKQMKSGGDSAPWVRMGASALHPRRPTQPPNPPTSSQTCSQANTCKDAMRIRFRSLRSVFAPFQEEVECGVHELKFIVPPDAPEYSVDMFLVHIDGEGMVDPPYSRLYPEVRQEARPALPPCTTPVAHGALLQTITRRLTCAAQPSAESREPQRRSGLLQRPRRLRRGPAPAGSRGVPSGRG